MQETDQNFTFNKILQLTKMNSSNKLYFFKGRQRANKIKTHKECHLAKKDIQISKYGEIICSHTCKQILKLQKFILTSDDWRKIVIHHDECNSCTNQHIVSLRMKSMYLFKLYKLLLQHYDTIKHFDDVASLAILEVSQCLDGLMVMENSPKLSKDLFLIKCPITLLMKWFCL